MFLARRTFVKRWLQLRLLEIYMLFRKITCAFKMFWFGFTHPDFLTEQAFVSMSKLFELCFKCVNDDKPYCSHLYLGGHRIASLWIYLGLSKNPIDRIADLLGEIAALKETAQQQPTGQAQNAANIVEKNL